MTRITFLIAIALLAWLLLRWFVRTPPKQVITTVKRTGFILAMLGLVFLVVTGRLNILFAVGAAALPFLKRGFMLIRYLPMAQSLWGRVAGRASAGSTNYSAPFSTMETRFLRVSLDTGTGNLDGEVLEGAFEGQFLSKMTLDNLLVLFNTCQSQDPRSVALLAAYLDRHQPGWREKSHYDGDEQQSNEQRHSSSSSMAKSEALDILGIEANASKDEITQAHRRLIHKLHPDRGGSTYLAAKINQAKDYLLNH